MARVTIIARADQTGLGVQSKNWVRLLNPNKTIVIDSTRFNGNQQHLEWYRDNNRWIIEGRIQPDHFPRILSHTDVLLTFEIPYNYGLFSAAKAMGVKTVLQNNWEFTDYLRHPNLELPDLLVNHSYWHLEDQKSLWPEITDYCPSPLFIEDFNENYQVNSSRKGIRRFLHVAGRSTYEDRNGTKDLLAAVKLIPAEIPFVLVIKTQTVPVDLIEDSRVIIDTDSPVNEKYLYYDFDAMLLPRRYAGACLPMNEALASGLPVVMPNIEPNNRILPDYWLVKADKKSTFMARTEVDVYETDPQALADKIKDIVLMDKLFLDGQRVQARLIAKKEFSHAVVWDKWAGLMRRIGL